MISLTHKGKIYTIKFLNRRAYRYDWQSTEYYCLLCGKQSIIEDPGRIGYGDEGTMKYCLECGWENMEI